MKKHKRVYDDEGELSEETLKHLEEARRTPLSEYIPLEEVQKSLLRKRARQKAL